MQHYTALTFNTNNTDTKEILTAILNDAGFEGFEEGDDYVKAFIPSEIFAQLDIAEILSGFEMLKPLAYTTENIVPTNWNAEWEKNFQPVYVSNQIQIRASFHPKQSDYPIDIVIDPKMSFGTGHHETTYMMSETMLNINFNNKTVFDFGSGTGILSILAAKLGAKNVCALDHEEWAYYNCVENAMLNNVLCIETVFGDEEKFPTTSFDIILANINRNIISKNMTALAALMHAESKLLISGFLTNDEKDLLALATKNNLTLLGDKEKNGWVCLSLVKKPLITLGSFI